MTKDEFENKLKSHDWYYMMSDDGFIYRKGASAQGELERIAASTPEFARLFDDYWFKHFCPPSFPTAKRETAPMIAKGLYVL